MSTGRRTYTASSRSTQLPSTPARSTRAPGNADWFPVSPTSTPSSSFAPSFSVSTPSSTAPRSTYAPSVTDIDPSDASDILDLTDSMASMQYRADSDVDDYPRPASPILFLAPFPNPVCSAPSTPRSTAPPRSVPTPSSRAPPPAFRTAPPQPATTPSTGSAAPRAASPSKPSQKPLPRVDGPLSRGQVMGILKRFEEPAIRDLLAQATANDNQENISLAHIVHFWHVLSWNTRHAIILVLRTDIWNKVRLMDRLTDTSTCVFVVEPTVPDGTVLLDPAHTPVVHIYKPRSIKTGSQQALHAHRVMETAWRHGIAAPHVAAFRARVEHLMAEHSPYQDLPLLTLTNQIHPSRFIVAPPSPSATEQSPEAIRAMDRRRRQAQHGLPELPEFVAYIAKLNLTREQREHVKNVVLDTQVVPPRRKLAEKAAKARAAHMRTGKRAPVTPAQLAQRRENKAKRLKRITDVAVEQTTQLIGLSKELNVSEKWLKGHFNAHNYYAKRTRKVNVRNAFMKAKAKEYTKVTGRRKLMHMRKDPELDAEFNALTDAERDALVKDLEQHREEKENVMHHSAAAQHADASQNLEAAVKIITGVANRCNGVFLFYYANKDGDAHGAGMHAVSQEAQPFITNVLKTTPDALAGRFDAFAMSGSAEVDAPRTTNVYALKSTARECIASGFRKLVPRESAKIFYNPLRMLKSYGLEFVGWKGGELPDPGNMNTASALTELINAVEAGTAHWQRVEPDDIDERAQAIIARGEAIGVAYDAPRARRSDHGSSHKSKTPLAPSNQNVPAS
ncbi:hypothetical protein EXIGLDRAFT_707202 [Exidia glandulosa HHB12029]|uniref:Uncharacterized protein n=1 Tax=Exidia glandulosa HHB12029 TaxID=1314781 RepID=A0A165JY00_EXIGL|nr:hypothetical protein EXIGLDRAFT_707202 [Exidia glandulosa HHB12029]